MPERYRSSAPASSANLGPGFDVLALALELRCTVTAESSERWSVEGGEEELPMRAARRVGTGLPPLRITIESEIPIARGLGSSAAVAAATIAAVLLARGRQPDPRRVFEAVSELEGHPDNAAAAVYGGLVLCSPGGEVLRLPIHPGLHPLVAVAQGTLPTSEARAILRPTVARALAVRTLARTAALVAGFLTADPVMFSAAAGDEFHEGPRSRVHPEPAELIEVARAAGAVHACWSGAGPSILVLTLAQDRERVKTALEKRLPDGRVLSPSIATAGLMTGLT